MKRSFGHFFAGLLLTGLVAPLAAETDFYRDVYPFLKANCISCHNKTTTKAGLNMETPELMLKGGDSGPAIVPGKSAESYLVEASSHTTDPEMPPKKNKTGAVKLTPKELAILKLWIDEGAKSSVQQARNVVWQPLAKGVHPIYALAMSDEGRFAACGRSNAIFLYDLATRQLLTRIGEDGESAHRGLIHSIAFSPDGERLASGSYREVKIWRKEKAKSTSRKGDAALNLVASELSADGKQIVAADKAGALLILNAADGKLIRKIDGVGPAGIQLVSLSPDGARAAVFESSWRLSVWNLADGKLLHAQDTPDSVLEAQHQAAKEKQSAAAKAETAANAALKQTPEDAKSIETHKAAQANSTNTKKEADAVAAKISEARKVAVSALTWTADGKFIATGGSDNRIRIWPLPFAAPTELNSATGTTTLAAGFTPDQLVSASGDGKVRIWSLKESKVIREIPAAGITGIDLTADGKRLVTSDAKGAVRILDTTTGKQISELSGGVELSRQIAKLEFTIAAQILEQAFQKTVVTRIGVETKALDELLSKAKDAVVAMKKKLPTVEKAVKPAQEARDAAQKVVDEAVAALAAAPEDAKLKAAIVTAKDKLITAQTKVDDAEAALAAVKSNVPDAEAQQKKINDAKAQNEKELAAANKASESAKALQTSAAAELASAKKELTKVDAKPLAVSFSADAEQVAAAFDDGSVRVWAVATGTPIDQAQGASTTTASLIHRGDGAFAVCGFDSTLTVTPASSKWTLERVLVEGFADRVNAVCFSPDGKTLAAGSGEPSRTGDIILFDVATGKPSATWKERHADSVLCLDFSPDGKLLASGAADMIARVTEVATGKQTNLFEGHTHYVSGVAFRSDGRVLATAGADGVVNSWDMIIGERKKKIVGWTKEVTSLQFIGATNQIVTSAGDNLIRIVNDDGAQIRAIAKLPDFMQAAASTPSGALIIGGGEDSFLRIWNGADGKEIAAFGMK
ncbi:MAG: WD40 repeat protein [Verrucomicrobiales bacterium]|jgi:WD40 repeat protein